jgi:hypothetical protein
MASQGERDSRRLTILWAAAALALVGLIGLLLVPSARIVWIVLLVFALAAIPQAWIRHGAGERERRP